jgi:uroporphyrinogen-III synthase
MPRPRILVTRAAGQADDLLSALRSQALDPVLVPAIAVEVERRGGPLDRAAGSLHVMDWVVVTSANGACAILRAAERVLTELGSPRWAAIGASTAAVLECEGIEVAFQPRHALGRVLADDLPLRPGDRIVVIRGDLADANVAARLRERGAEVDDVIGYRTALAPGASVALLASALAAGRMDGVILTSGSTVSGLLRLAEAARVDVRSIPAICIGPETARAATAAGLQVVARASSPNASSLAAAAAAAITARPVEFA